MLYRACILRYVVVLPKTCKQMIHKMNGVTFNGCHGWQIDISWYKDHHKLSVHIIENNDCIMWLIHCHNKAAVHLYYFRPKVEYSVAMESQFIHQRRIRLNGTILISNIYKNFCELNNELFKRYCWPVWWRLFVFQTSWSYIQNNSLFLWPVCRPDWKYWSISSFNK